MGSKTEGALWKTYHCNWIVLLYEMELSETTTSHLFNYKSCILESNLLEEYIVYFFHEIFPSRFITLKLTVIMKLYDLFCSLPLCDWLVSDSFCRPLVSYYIPQQMFFLFISYLWFVLLFMTLSNCWLVISLNNKCAFKMWQNCFQK